MTRSKIFKEAHKIAKEIRIEFCSYKKAFSHALRILFKKSKVKKIANAVLMSVHQCKVTYSLIKCEICAYTGRPSLVFDNKLGWLETNISEAEFDKLRGENIEGYFFALK